MVFKNHTGHPIDNGELAAYLDKTDQLIPADCLANVSMDIAGDSNFLIDKNSIVLK